MYKFNENEVIIPSIVLEEINKLKEENSERGYYARQVIDVLEKISCGKPLLNGIVVDKTKTLIKTSYNLYNKEIASKLSMDVNDYKIIACAKNHNGILITRDKMMRIIARDFIKVEEYEADKLKTKEIYKGYRKVKDESGGDIINVLYSKKELDNIFNLYPNEFVIIENIENPQHIGIGICKNNKIIPVDFKKIEKGKITPINLEQKMFLYLLHDEDIKCITVIGTSGKGKSLLAIDYAINKVCKGEYNKFLYTKSAKAVDESEELGFYKGDVNEKLKPHLQPLYNSIEFLYQNEIYRGGKSRISVEQKLEELISQDIIGLYPLANIRGMSIFNKIVMLDEAQNTTKHMIKSLVTRVNDNSKLIVAGDIEQIDDKKLNKYNNGLVHLIEASKEEDFIAHITMDIDDRSRRGKLSEFGSKKL